MNYYIVHDNCGVAMLVRHEEFEAGSFDRNLVDLLLVFWVAVKELNLSYHIGETLLFTIYTHYGN